MEQNNLVIEAVIDAAQFRRFAWFDTFVRQGRWRSPMLFCAIMLAFSAACFALRSRAAQATLLAGILLAIGVLLPVGYVLQFALSIRAQIKRMGLETPRHAYTLAFQRDTGVSISAGQRQSACPWIGVHQVWRVPGCIYLYTTAQQAYLLPTKTGADDQALWQLLRACIPPERLHEHTRKMG